ncbi:ankyrin repeat domain-containing protein [Bdellovibrio bacteriovorus]
MRTWNQYKQTMRTDTDVFEWARSGDVQSLMAMNLADLHLKNEKGYSPLMLAAYHGHQQACLILITRGADVNSNDLAGNSILMGVAFKGHLEIANMLVSHGADVSYRNPKGQSALEFAQLFGRSEVVKFLKEKQNKKPEFTFKDFFLGWSSMLRKKGSN